MNSVWSKIQSLHHEVAKMWGLESYSLWQLISSFLDAKFVLKGDGFKLMLLVLRNF